MPKSILTLIFILLCIHNLTTATENRYALVIGNAAYLSARLENPVNDATDMTAKLKQRGFTVTRLVDANQQRMEQAIKSFTNKLTGTNSVGIFYYAGHGLEVEGENYWMQSCLMKRMSSPVVSTIKRDVMVRDAHHT